MWKEGDVDDGRTDAEKVIEMLVNVMKKNEEGQKELRSVIEKKLTEEPILMDVLSRAASCMFSAVFSWCVITFNHNNNITSDWIMWSQSSCWQRWSCVATNRHWWNGNSVCTTTANIGWFWQKWWSSLVRNFSFSFSFSKKQTKILTNQTHTH